MNIIKPQKTMSVNNKCGSISVGSIVRISSAKALHMKLVQVSYQTGLTVEHQQEQNCYSGDTITTINLLVTIQSS